MVVIHWLKGKHDLKQFIKNRVSEIINTIPLTCWRHCLGKDNPADWVSRGFKLNTVIAESNWWKGPSWLSFNKEFWPVSKVETSEEVKGEIYQEVRISKSTILVSFSTAPI